MSKPATPANLTALIASVEIAQAEFEAARDAKFMQMGAYNHRGTFMQSQQTANLAAQEWQRAKDALVQFVVENKDLIAIGASQE